MVKTGNSRGFDAALPSNRYVLAATPIAGAVAGLIALVGGEGLAQAVRTGVSAGGGLFLGWALARELDPDHQLTAVLASLAAPLGVISGDPDLLAAGLLLVVARIVAFTTGRAPYWIDLVVVVALAGPLAFRDSGPGPLLACGIGMAWVTAIQDRRKSIVGLGAAALVALGAFSATRADWAPLADEPVAVALMLVSGAAIFGPRRVRAGTDRPGGEVPPRRVQVARVGVWSSAVVAAMTGEVSALAPAWAVLCAIAVWGLVRDLRRRFAPSP